MDAQPRAMRPRSLTFRGLQARLLPNGWLDLLRQIALFGAAYLCYSAVRAMAEVQTAVAFDHTREVIQLERTLHIFVEPSIQAWAMGSHALIDIASWLYVNAQTTVTIAALAYIYLRHNRSFYFVRNMLMISMAIALIGYAVFPTAPPRFMPEWGFVDTVASLAGTHVGHETASMSALFNPYAAVPSMHVAFAVMIGWRLVGLVKLKIAKVAWALYPFLIAFVIVATANHFIFDALLGVVTAGISAFAAHGLARLRPVAWRFSNTPAQANG
ncbi:MAG: phosphatase PAP2 family protein [Solirubrobacteraceae bacterium]